uniref:Ovule protein n=1 Tax=Heterorhabditis bacteriophora TaxID=37862 RepID=A0A1I7XDC8_HETBA
MANEISEVDLIYAMGIERRLVRWMANPSNNTFPPKLGFPQAFGNSSYQPVTQFSQFQAPLLNYQANGIAGAPSAAPFPTILNNQQSPFPSMPTQLPVASTQLAYNTPTHNFSSNYSFPSTEPLPPVPRAPADSGAPPTHKPYMEQTTYQPSFSDVIPNGLPNIPV